MNGLQSRLGATEGRTGELETRSKGSIQTKSTEKPKSGKYKREGMRIYGWKPNTHLIRVLEGKKGKDEAETISEDNGRKFSRLVKTIMS